MRNACRVAAASLLALTACAMPESGSSAGLEIDYEKYELENGLDVVLHLDRSDPVAAVAMTFHVGSAREVEGRTGFAHLFEHLFFLDSENLGPGGLDRLMTRVGSSTNGSTSRDRTNYFEVVPNDALEKTLWAEADKLGYFINTVTESVLAKEKQVVKNEKRQGVDNRPYGHVSYVIDQALYPDDHPYQWQVIGSLEDLDAATLADVKEFHTRWYGPNNATLVVAGDIDVAQTKEWIEKYFGEIPSRPLPEVPAPPAITLDSTYRLYHEDNFARLPQLTIAWPSVPLYHEDSYALDVLADLLADGKSTPLYEVLVEEQELAPDVFASNGSQELAGRFTLQIRTYADKDLDDVMAAVDSAFARFERDGVVAEELDRVKAGYETGFYGGLSSALGKAFQLAQYNIFAPSPGYVSEDLERLLAVTAEDVTRVYESYIRGRPYVAASFVPQGQVALALETSQQADVVEEPIVQGAEEPVVVADRGEIPQTPSAFDRSVEPPFGDAPSIRTPEVFQDTLANGLRVLAIEDRETPLVQFALRIRSGLLLEDPDKTGVANLLAEMLTEGTANRTAEELELAIDKLGASINVNAGAETITINGSTLARNYDSTMELVEEILMEPRWDPEEFQLAKQRVLNELRQRSATPTALAQDAFNRLLYGDHIMAMNPRGSEGSVTAISIEDLQRYHAQALGPNQAAMLVAGAVAPQRIVSSLAGLSQRWEAKDVEFPAAPQWESDRAALYFLDVPNASQSVLAIGYLSLAETHPDYYPATVMNFRLGGGGFASDLTQVLREQRGYTYGVGSGFSGGTFPGPFAIRSSVRSNVTYEALQIIKDLVERHGPEFDAEDLEATKSFLIKNNAMAFETLFAKVGMLADMSTYGFPADYVEQREQIVRDMTTDRVRELATQYLDPNEMIWLVVGDGRTQRARLAQLGLGQPVPVDRDGRPITMTAAR